MNILLLPLGFILSLWTLWVIFLAVMSLKRARDTVGLSFWCKFFGYPVVCVGLLIDFAANVFLLSLILLEAPKEGTVTARLKRHNQGPDGWRKSVAKWAEQLLDRFDPSGDHI
ncbi:hypothetical protein J2W88_003918 [Acidovorax delafieldii]|uniref:Uncharacterized protein n=1 Tax=Acidovorax delafieldii TaxID=47920 RepID=A0AAJ2F3A8_ACIDE|nr:hypothetical protein [Acidovorax delafieldii]MDR6768614.1 hypothetical protein [Acidovorax delafieldii]MDR6837329.1 hypothetical protein [Acidovorax delafieldii]MDR7366820.1 hypothetical protein [Acidovorax delafieldii]